MALPRTSGPRPTARVRWRARVAILSAAVALAISPFTHPAIARADYDQQFYNFCLANLGQGMDYCCAHAGGSMQNGKCT
jgi:hypothetical protein